jgi:hypothetical protein
VNLDGHTRDSVSPHTHQSPRFLSMPSNRFRPVGDGRGIRNARSSILAPAEHPDVAVAVAVVEDPGSPTSFRDAPTRKWNGGVASEPFSKDSVRKYWRRGESRPKLRLIKMRDGQPSYSAKASGHPWIITDPATLPARAFRWTILPACGARANVCPAASRPDFAWRQNPAGGGPARGRVIGPHRIASSSRRGRQCAGPGRGIEPGDDPIIGQRDRQSARGDPH